MIWDMLRGELIDGLGGVVTAADYTGKAIKNYRFSSVVYPRDSNQTSFCPRDVLPTTPSTYWRLEWYRSCPSDANARAFGRYSTNDSTMEISARPSVSAFGSVNRSVVSSSSPSAARSTRPRGVAGMFSTR